MEFTYVTRTPAAYARWAESIWYARGRIPYAREQIAPTGSTVAVAVLGDPIRLTADGGTYVAETGFLLGPHDHPVLNEPLGETWCVGIVTTPVGCRALLGVDPARHRGRVGPWPGAAALTTAGRSPETALDVVERSLRVAAPSPAVLRCEAALAALAADPRRSIAGLAAELGVSHGHLDREFTAVSGLSPRMLSRILRLRRLLDAIDIGAARIGWTALAADYGWFDQSHFIRDFRRHTGVTPSAYVAAQRAHFTPEQASPGFTPEIKSVQDPDPADAAP